MDTWPQAASTELLDYTLDWSTWLPVGDAISTSNWVATGLTSSSASISGNKTTIWLTGGTAGSDYTITNTITTTGGRTGAKTVIITIGPH